LSYSTISGARYSRISQSSFASVEFRDFADQHVRWFRTIFDECTFSGVTLGRKDNDHSFFGRITEVWFRSCAFERVKFERIEFERVNFVDCTFDDVTMNECRFVEDFVNVGTDSVTFEDCSFFKRRGPATVPVSSGRMVVSSKLEPPDLRFVSSEFFQGEVW
jgi:uncharacterized protein YjbI with pentapeptide repeats